MVGCDAHMGGAVFEEGERRSQGPANGTNFGSVRVRVTVVAAVELAEQFVSAVDQMYLHAPSLSDGQGHRRLNWVQPPQVGARLPRR